MRLQVLDRPISLGTVEPETLSAIRERFPPGWFDPYGLAKHTWYEGDSYTSIDGALRPLLDMVRGSISKIERVSFWVDTNNALPGEAQRSTTFWHRDENAREVCIVTDTLPTEILVRAPGLHGLKKILEQRRLAKIDQFEVVGGHVLSKEEVISPHVEVFKPDPYDFVAIIGQLHRSAINTTDEVIERTWVRAAVS